MKLEVFGSEEVEKVIKLKLIQGDNQVLVTVVNQDGKTTTRGNLIAIRDDGTLERIPSVYPGFGFDCDDRGRIKETEE